jgi:NADH:ubiquinone oxidoreductase subunit 6 (subunit J)
MRVRFPLPATGQPGAAPFALVEQRAMQTSFHISLLDLFASIALISATMVIVSKNPIHSVAFLTLVFCNATGLLISSKIEFIAVTLVTIYVGAIAVLFLFVVMMLNIKVNESREN